MFQRIGTAAVCALLGLLGASAQAAGFEDCAPVGHLPTYPASAAPERRNYDTAEFMVLQKDEVQYMKVSGRWCTQAYGPKDPQQDMGSVEITENYLDQLKKLGAQILFKDDSNVVARLQKPNAAPTWISVYGESTNIRVTVVDEKEFKPSIEAPKAENLKTALDRDGHVPLYVNFDFGKATLLPDAQPVVGEVARLMKANPALKLAIEGHTDGVGQHDANVSLSQQRAQAVVAALTKAGVPADHLKAAGYGPDKPIADNNSSEGRAKNRRVELVRLKG